MSNLTTANQIIFIGQRVTAQRRPNLPGGDEWVVIGWEKGIPVATKPISSEALKVYLERYDYTLS